VSRPGLRVAADRGDRTDENTPPAREIDKQSTAADPARAIRRVPIASGAFGR